MLKRWTGFGIEGMFRMDDKPHHRPKAVLRQPVRTTQGFYSFGERGLHKAWSLGQERRPRHGLWGGDGFSYL